MARRIELFTLPNGDKFVLKESRQSGEVLRVERDAILTNENSPSAQDRIIQEASMRYKSKYNEDLPVEQLLGFFIDKKTTKRYSLYSYHLEIKPDILTDEGENQMEIARRKRNLLTSRLEAVGVYPGESAGPSGTNFIITKNESPEGIGVVLIDTEFWKLK